jgi:hypothetical protein
LRLAEQTQPSGIPELVNAGLYGFSGVGSLISGLLSAPVFGEPFNFPTALSPPFLFPHRHHGVPLFENLA